nr:hypothetical 3K protein - rice dwarf virus [Rice dwarf virus]
MLQMTNTMLIPLRICILLFDHVASYSF